MFRLDTVRLLDASTPVTECGYRNNASAEPSASVAYCNWLVLVSRIEPLGLPVVGRTCASDACAWSKMLVRPPKWIGRGITATVIPMEVRVALPNASTPGG